MNLIPVDQFKARFDDVDQVEVQNLINKGIEQIEPVDITALLAERATKDQLIVLAESVSKAARANYPESGSVWKEYRPPVLDITPLREAYFIRFNDGMCNLIQNPYSGSVCFEVVPEEHIQAHLGNNDTAVAIADRHCIIVARKMRVTNEKLEVVNGVLQYELFPYVVSVLGLAKAKEKHEPFFDALSVIISGFDPLKVFGTAQSEAKTFYEKSKNDSRALLELVKADN